MNDYDGYEDGRLKVLLHLKHKLLTNHIVYMIKSDDRITDIDDYDNVTEVSYADDKYLICSKGSADHIKMELDSSVHKVTQSYLDDRINNIVIIQKYIDSLSLGQKDNKVSKGYLDDLF